MALYELLIRGKADGTIAGAHAIDFDANGVPGLPRPITVKDFPAIAKDFNAAALARVGELEAEAARLNSVLTAARNAFDKGDVDAMNEIRRKVDLPEKQRQLETIDAEIAERAAKRDVLAKELNDDESPIIVTSSRIR